MRKVERILVAVDLGETTEATCAAAVELARAYGAEVVFFHVYDVSGFEELQREAPSLYLDQVLDNLRMQVRSRVGRLEEVPARFRVEVVPDGPVVQAILDAAERYGADLLVMGTHGRTGLERMLLGSVAEGVLRRAKIPVVVVPARAARAVGEALAG
ncbi:MAG: universal stress protein [Armatimonadota bacterium]|nr:universal stress protein [Armatimonadota bacterium]MDW8156974.1 universal stress protein [Armatimonadota bacterium]